MKKIEETKVQRISENQRTTINIIHNFDLTLTYHLASIVIAKAIFSLPFAPRLCTSSLPLSPSHEHEKERASFPKRIFQGILVGKCSVNMQILDLIFRLKGRGVCTR